MSAVLTLGIRGWKCRKSLKEDGKGGSGGMRRDRVHWAN
jgi:hypothetical protein